MAWAIIQREKNPIILPTNSLGNNPLGEEGSGCMASHMMMTSDNMQLAQSHYLQWTIQAWSYMGAGGMEMISQAVGVKAPLAGHIQGIICLGMTNGTGSQQEVAKFRSRDNTWNRDNKESLIPFCKRSTALYCHFLIQTNMIPFEIPPNPIFNQNPHFSTTKLPGEEWLEEKDLTWEWQQRGLRAGACKGEGKGSDLRSILAVRMDAARRVTAEGIQGTAGACPFIDTLWGADDTKLQEKRCMAEGAERSMDHGHGMPAWPGTGAWVMLPRA